MLAIVRVALRDVPSILDEMTFSAANACYRKTCLFAGRLATTIGSSGCFKLLVILQSFTIVGGIATYFEERSDRAEERIVRMWNIATNEREGNSGKIPALEFLNKMGKPLTGISIPKAYLAGVNLSESLLSRANLNEANLDEANLREADLREADLREADLRDADISRANLSAANLGKADLSGANLTKAEVRDANLSKADLNAANLSAAGFIQTNLSGANLTLADLGEADLSGADLTGANLFQADLSGASFTSKNFGDAEGLKQGQLNKACADPETPPTGLPKDKSGVQLIWQGKPCG